MVPNSCNGKYSGQYSYTRLIHVPPAFIQTLALSLLNPVFARMESPGLFSLSWHGRGLLSLLISVAPVQAFSDLLYLIVISVSKIHAECSQYLCHIFQCGR